MYTKCINIKSFIMVFVLAFCTKASLGTSTKVVPTKYKVSTASIPTRTVGTYSTVAYYYDDRGNVGTITTSFAMNVKSAVIFCDLHTITNTPYYSPRPKQVNPITLCDKNNNCYGHYSNYARIFTPPSKAPRDYLISTCDVFTSRTDQPIPTTNYILTEFCDPKVEYKTGSSIYTRSVTITNDDNSLVTSTSTYEYYYTNSYTTCQNPLTPRTKENITSSSSSTKNVFTGKIISNISSSTTTTTTTTTTKIPIPSSSSSTTTTTTKIPIPSTSSSTTTTKIPIPSTSSSTTTTTTKIPIPLTSSSTTTTTTKIPIPLTSSSTTTTTTKIPIPLTSSSTTTTTTKIPIPSSSSLNIATSSTK